MPFQCQKYTDFRPMLLVADDESMARERSWDRLVAVPLKSFTATELQQALTHAMQGAE